MNMNNLIKRVFRYLFVKRLAIVPFIALNDLDNSRQRMLFEWQKMPGGYRWH